MLLSFCSFHCTPFHKTRFWLIIQTYRFQECTQALIMPINGSIICLSNNIYSFLTSSVPNYTHRLSYLCSIHSLPKSGHYSCFISLKFQEEHWFIVCASHFQGKNVGFLWMILVIFSIALWTSIKTKKPICQNCRISSSFLPYGYLLWREFFYHRASMYLISSTVPSSCYV